MLIALILYIFLTGLIFPHLRNLILIKIHIFETYQKFLNNLMFNIQCCTEIRIIK